MDARETTIYHAILMAASIIGGIMIFLMASLIRQHRRTARFQKAIIDTEISTLEKERERMAADLHDELGPILAAAKFRLATIEVDSPGDKELILQAHDHLDSIIRRMRSISNNLMPNTLLRKGLSMAIDEFINSVANTSPLQITFLHDLAPPLLGKKSIHLYRIITEIIHNTLKHAKADRLDIHLFSRGERLILDTEDDGIGFDQQRVQRKKNGRGLQNILNRAEMLGAEVFMATHPGKGLHITIEIPITEELTTP